MEQGSESRESEDRINEPRTVGAIHIVPYTAGIGLHFLPLRAAGSALMLALFGGACSVIGLAAVSGLVRSGETATASMLALAFAGVFALPLLALGQLFIVIAIWTAANSLHVEVSSAGLRLPQHMQNKQCSGAQRGIRHAGSFLPPETAAPRILAACRTQHQQAKQANK